MRILFYGLFIFCLAFFLHLAIWKIRTPKSHTKALLQIFFATLILSFFLLWLISCFVLSSDSYLPKSFSDYIHIILFFAALTLAYITTYSAVEVDSPSFLITMSIYEAGVKGLHKDRLKETMRNELLVKPRVNDLLRDKLVFLSNNKYRVTKAGYRLINLFIFYRRLLGVTKKGG